MNLCFIGDIRSTHVQKFIAWFAKDNETHLISFDYIGDERVPSGMQFFQSIGTHIHLLKKTQLVLSPILAKRIIEKIKPDLIQAHFVTNYGFLGAYSDFHPLVICAQGDDVLIHPYKSKFYNWLVTFVLLLADRVICDGINELKSMKKLQIPTGKCELVYPGIDMRVFHPDKRKPTNHKTVIHLRGFDKIYDVDTLFWSMLTVHHNVPEARFQLVGIGTEHERFAGMVTDSPLKGFVEYLGQVENNALPELIASSDICISTSLSDGGIPVSTIEAMACGVPVVSTDAGDVGLWIQNGASGYIVNKQDSTKVAEKVIELLDDEPKRVQFGKISRRIVENKYDYETEMGKVEQIYQELLKEKR